MSRIFGLLILVPLGALAISFGASNGDPVTLRLFPLPGDVEAPLAAVLFGAMFLGVLLGGIAAWFGSGVLRYRARKAEMEARERERELQTMREKFAKAAEETMADGKGGQRAIGSGPANAGLIESGGSSGTAQGRAA